MAVASWAYCRWSPAKKEGSTKISIMSKWSNNFSEENFIANKMRNIFSFIFSYTELQMGHNYCQLGYCRSVVMYMEVDIVPNHIPRCKYISIYTATMFHWSVFSLLLHLVILPISSSCLHAAYISVTSCVLYEHYKTVRVPLSSAVLRRFSQRHPNLPFSKV